MNEGLRWSFDVPVIVSLAVTTFVYWRGRQVRLSLVHHALNSRNVWWRAATFYAGILAIFLALESPVDTLGATLFWAHMIQHLLLMMVAAPLLLLGDPAVTIMRGIPLHVRRAVLGSVARNRWLKFVAKTAARLAFPGPALVIFMVDLYVWHWSALFDLTLRNDTVHIVEHLCFLSTALLFWSQIIDQRAVHSRLSYPRRIVYLIIAAGTSNLLSMYFVFAPHPVYAYYSAIVHRPYGFTALGDQQLAGGIMWIPVLFVFGGAAAVLFFKWLAASEAATEAVPAARLTYSTLQPYSDIPPSGN